MVFEEIQQRLDQDLEEYKDDEEREREEKKHHLYQLKQYLQELPVVGFNTGKYDVNAMKIDFFTRLVDSHKIKYTVKRNNFMCIKTEKLMFLDITN